MSIAASGRAPMQTLRAATAVFLTLGGLSAALTVLFLGMRAVMDIGGACASGGPYVPRVECPDRVPLLMTGGIWGGFVFVGLYLWATSKHEVPTLAGFAWPALFLSLGWNFLEYGLDPPGGGGLVWGWLICALLFALMGGLPLVMMVKPILAQFGRAGAGPDQARFVVPTRPRVRELRSAWDERSGRFRSHPKRPPDGSGGGESLVDALERLGALHASGQITDAEFDAAKQRVLRGET